MKTFIVWQGSLEVNLYILIGSLLGLILPYRSLAWKWSIIKPVTFFVKLANSNLSAIYSPGYLLTCTCLSCTGKYRPSVVFVVQTSLQTVCTAMTLDPNFSSKIHLLA